MNTEPQKPRAKRNKTIVLTDDERTLYTKNLVFLDGLLFARSLEPQTTLAPCTTAPDTEKECAREPDTVSSVAPCMSATPVPSTAREPDTAFPAAPCISAAAFAPSAAPQTAPAPCTTAPDTEKECARAPDIASFDAPCIPTAAPTPSAETQTAAPDTEKECARIPDTAFPAAPSMSAAAPEPSSEPQTAPAPCTAAPDTEKECARAPDIASSDAPCISASAPEPSAAPQTATPVPRTAREPDTMSFDAPCIPTTAPEPDTESLAVDTIPEPVPTRVPLSAVLDKTVCADLFAVLSLLPDSFADLLIVDPPYNMAKNFHGAKFSRINEDLYTDYVRSWFVPLLRCLKPNASVYLCGDWKSSASLYRVLCEHTIVQNRITWQREKGRGAKANWKNTSEDIWFATCSQNYYFDVDAVKQKRRVLAPYRENGAPKDWEETKDGKFRLTYPGNFWDDISIPYWSMSENTDHPTQKSEKLIAKLILASCPVGGVVLDPFLGSGTTAVTAKKLGRRFVGIEQNAEYCLWAQKRLARAQEDGSIQGYTDGVFWERNSQKDQNRRHR